MEIQNESVESSTYIKMRNKAADTFTPFRIKDLSDKGKVNMGTYGICALSLLFVLTVLNLWALVKSDASIIVIFNSILAFIVSLFTLEKYKSPSGKYLLRGFKQAFLGKNPLLWFPSFKKFVEPKCC